MKRFTITTLIALSSVIIFNSSCSTHENTHNEEKPTTFLVTKPWKKDTNTYKEYVAQIQSIQHIELRALERGYLKNIHVDEGDFVREGQLLFEILPLVYTAELNMSKAEVSFARIEYENTKALADSNVVSPNELALARAKYDKALAELSLAETHLNFTKIRAPFDGIINRFHVRKGSLLDEGELLTELADNSTMWVYFNVPESEYIEYQTNVAKDSVVSVELQMANGAMFPETGIIETIEADFNNETGNIPFRARFSNPTRLLRHGETGSILLPQKYPNALIIPQNATFEILDRKYVYVVNKDHVIETRPIEVAEELPHLYIVNKGLEPNDLILLEGLRKVRDGNILLPIESFGKAMDHHNEEEEEQHNESHETGHHATNGKRYFQYIEPDAVMNNITLYAE